MLLVHEPDYADEAPPGFALQLSGHSHGGQIRVPGLPPLHVPKYSTHYPEGLQQGPHHPVYTTRGVGTTGPPIRLFCPPEVTVLTSTPPEMPPFQPHIPGQRRRRPRRPDHADGDPAGQLHGQVHGHRRPDARPGRRSTASAGTPDARRKSIRQQLRLFHRRIAALWAASGALLMALLSFLVTVLSLVFVQHTSHISVVGAASIVVGLVFILIAVMLELYEIGLARLTTAGELRTCSLAANKVEPDLSVRLRRRHLRSLFTQTGGRVNQSQVSVGGRGMAERTGRELAGLAVVTLAGGERLGRVDDVVFHAATGRVTGFLVGLGGLLGKTRFLPAGQAQSLGADALTVPGADVLQDKSAAQRDPDEVSGKSLEGLPVLNESGTVIGKVADIVVDDQALLVSLALATGLLDNVLHGKPHLPVATIKAIGKDSIVIPDSYDPKAHQ